MNKYVTFCIGMAIGMLVVLLTGYIAIRYGEIGNFCNTTEMCYEYNGGKLVIRGPNDPIKIQKLHSSIVARNCVQAVIDHGETGNVEERIKMYHNECAVRLIPNGKGYDIFFDEFNEIGPYRIEVNGKMAYIVQ